MNLTLTADWTNPTPGNARIAIGGYTAVIEPGTIDGRLVDAYEFTILRDHFEIVEVGVRTSVAKAKQAVEAIIADHVQKIQESATA